SIYRGKAQAASEDCLDPPFLQLPLYKAVAERGFAGSGPSANQDGDGGMGPMVPRFFHDAPANPPMQPAPFLCISTADGMHPFGIPEGFAGMDERAAFFPRQQGEGPPKPPFPPWKTGIPRHAVSSGGNEFAPGGFRTPRAPAGPGSGLPDPRYRETASKGAPHGEDPRVPSPERAPGHPPKAPPRSVPGKKGWKRTIHRRFDRSAPAHGLPRRPPGIGYKEDCKRAWPPNPAPGRGVR